MPAALLVDVTGCARHRCRARERSQEAARRGAEGERPRGCGVGCGGRRRQGGGCRLAIDGVGVSGGGAQQQAPIAHRRRRPLVLVVAPHRHHPRRLHARNHRAQQQPHAAAHHSRARSAQRPHRCNRTLNLQQQHRGAASKQSCNSSLDVSQMNSVGLWTPALLLEQITPEIYLNALPPFQLLVDQCVQVPACGIAKITMHSKAFAMQV